jgi:purine-binding chemotaxis protein CheW
MSDADERSDVSGAPGAPGAAADRTTAVLRQRAEELARPPEDGRRDTRYSVAVLGLGEERIAIEAGYLREIVKVPPVAPVPSTPPCITGITQLRGELLAVVDLAHLLGVSLRGERPFLAIVDAAEGPLGLLVEQVLGFREIRAEELSAIGAADPRRPVRAITRDLVTTLDMERLLASEDLRVGSTAPSRAGAATAGRPDDRPGLDPDPTITRGEP